MRRPRRDEVRRRGPCVECISAPQMNEKQLARDAIVSNRQQLSRR
jgi:hypothetical protein